MLYIWGWFIGLHNPQLLAQLLEGFSKNKYSHAKRAADAHSIIFEEDLDSEGELERTTYYNEPVKNFDLNED